MSKNKEWIDRYNLLMWQFNERQIMPKEFPKLPIMKMFFLLASLGMQIDVKCRFLNRFGDIFRDMPNNSVCAYRAFCIAKEVAQSGDVGAQKILAFYYHSGIGCSSNEFMGAVWSRISMQSDDEVRELSQVEIEVCKEIHRLERKYPAIRHLK